MLIYGGVMFCNVKFTCLVVRASALLSVDLGSISQSSQTKKLKKLIFTSFLRLTFSIEGIEKCKDKPASLLVVYLVP